MWEVNESSQLITATRVIDISMCERLPVVIVIGVQMHRIVSRPVFDSEFPGVRRAPQVEGDRQRAVAQSPSELLLGPALRPLGRAAFIEEEGAFRLPLRVNLEDVDVVLDCVGGDTLTRCIPLDHFGGPDDLKGAVGLLASWFGANLGAASPST